MSAGDNHKYFYGDSTTIFDCPACINAIFFLDFHGMDGRFSVLRKRIKCHCNFLADSEHIK
jgi:hypothetical protein